MKDLFDDHPFLVIAIVFLILAVGVEIGIRIGRHEVRKEAVQMGYAEYNPTNAVWHWKTLDNVR
jgi:predicted transporter